MKRKKQTPEDKLDEIFSTYIRLRDADLSGYINCYCCDKPVFWKYAHNMHYFGRGNTNTRYFDKNCHAGCSVCNTHLNGNLKAYKDHLIKDYGEEIIYTLTVMKNTYMKYSDYELKGLIIHYRNEVNKLKKEKGL